MTTNPSSGVQASQVFTLSHMTEWQRESQQCNQRIFTVNIARCFMCPAFLDPSCIFRHKHLLTALKKTTTLPCVAVLLSLFWDRNANISYLFVYECPPANVSKTQMQRVSALIRNVQTQQVVTLTLMKSCPTAPLCGHKLTWQSEIPEITEATRSKELGVKRVYWGSQWPRHSAH